MKRLQQQSCDPSQLATVCNDIEGIGGAIEHLVYDTNKKLVIILWRLR